MNNIIHVGKHTLTCNVSRHTHESWELIYCTCGSGTVIFDDRSMDYRKSDIIVIPPMTPHINKGSEGSQNIHINMISPALSVSSPMILSDDSNLFLLNIFHAVYFYFISGERKALPLLMSYGDLLSCYLSVYGVRKPLTPIVEEIKNNILSNYSNSSYKLDVYMRSLPFCRDYLRKLFQKEIGVTPHQYLTDIRLRKAMELLAGNPGGKTIADIASLCGFHDSLYFSKIFKKRYGSAPGQFLRKAPDHS